MFLTTLVYKECSEYRADLEATIHDHRRLDCSLQVPHPVSSSSTMPARVSLTPSHDHFAFCVFLRAEGKHRINRKAGKSFWRPQAKLDRAYILYRCSTEKIESKGCLPAKMRQTAPRSNQVSKIQQNLYLSY